MNLDHFQFGLFIRQLGNMSEKGKTPSNFIRRLTNTYEVPAVRGNS